LKFKMKKEYDLIICEKKDAAKRIAEALADEKPKQEIVNKIPYFEITHNNKKILVATAVGHLFVLSETKKIKGYPNFDIAWKPSSEVSKKTLYTKNYYDLLTKLTKRASTFTVGTDLDAEGELIGRNILKFICKKENAKRMKFSTLTKEELIEAYDNADESMDLKLVEAGETRHFMDHYFGVNTSKALTSAVKTAGLFQLLSSGRVQSPILALISEKEKEIQAFKPKDFWQLIAKVDTKEQVLEALHKEDKFWDKKQVDAIYENTKDKNAIVKQVKTRQSQTKQPKPFNITSLQTEAYKNFGFSPKQTLDIAESLYLKAYISYPRTSSEKLPPSIGYKKIIQSLSKLSILKESTSILLAKKTLLPNQGFKTDPAHIALHPTHTIPKLEKLRDVQKKLYLIIAKRFLATFSDPALRESMEIQFDINNEIFKTKGSRTLEKNWISMYEPYVKFKDVQLPALKEGQEFNVKDLILKEDQTKPPAHYTQGSIISEMEKRNLGTRATRANILQILYDRNYIEEKSIEITDLGKSVINVLEKYVPDLISEKLTRHFEEHLEKIQGSKVTEEEVLEETRTFLTKTYDNFKKHEKKIGNSLVKALKETRDKVSILGKCTKCNEGDLRILYSRKTKKKFVACNAYPKCRNTFSLTTGKITPTEEVCQFCNTPIIQVQRTGRRPFKMCLEFECKSKESWGEKKDKNNQKASSKTS
tara:strand:+ start:5009 stop:7123 length:2115 start_codon:yes stop_codon:yes gene_type:complete